MSYGYIYKTENKHNGKAYVGQHRGEFDSSYLGSGLNIRSAIQKYGKDKFCVSVLAVVNTREEANELERKYIEDLKNTLGKPNVYNIAKGGEGGDTITENPNKEMHREKCRIAKIINPPVGLRRKHTPEELEKMRQPHFNQRGEKNWLYGKKRTQEFRDQVRAANTGTRMVNKNGNNKWVHSEELDSFIENGWSIGMLTKRRSQWEVLI